MHQAIRGLVKTVPRDIRSVNIVGNADACLGAEADMALSRQRALLVERWLLEAGVAREKIKQVTWLGDARPKARPTGSCSEPVNDWVGFEEMELF